MAGDWIKVESTTPDKPEVAGMAARLRLDPDAVVGKLIRIWAWADAHSIGGDAIPVAESFVDLIARQRRFAAAMRAVGWLEGEDGALSFPGFARHNGTTAKERAATNRRVAKWRGCNAKGTPDVTPGTLLSPLGKPLPEKRRVREREREADGGLAKPLLDAINSLRPAWAAAPVLDASEAAAAGRNLAALEAIEPATWDTMRAYLAARLPEGSAGWQPRLRGKFLESPGNLASSAVDWARKRRDYPGTSPKLTPVRPPDEPPLTAAEIAELFKSRSA